MRLSGSDAGPKQGWCRKNVRITNRKSMARPANNFLTADRISMILLGDKTTFIALAPFFF
ncbi:MAG: hypothetical protein A2374_03070 [Candidatus Moranbacteria bacterium RIFOXYB1_FULL_44_23]|nr:MAG: hypothetical protein A2374_03070 [Candidatus Moranbacteria bacterium RIFOXYB1_FULL_44_23]OGI42998.1 MAG: hypothetical protein A2593_02610 [Candidatus Moranbacteria bacterium RIFOXYD1_FULL_44_9]HBB36563.1 hypothetical protein [Candidatus Moranbacteria bacterium]HBU25330.1 hypothetical protein [Candidatus Moranbacteria bacterium]